jgi:tartrate dehydratase beta subunit/fumarate hydratase class I family protein
LIHAGHSLHGQYTALSGGKKQTLRRDSITRNEKKGKGERSDAVIDAMKRRGAVYFGAIGGAGALLARCITAQEVIAWPELGPEALRKLTVKDMPLIVVIDAEGHDLYKEH